MIALLITAYILAGVAVVAIMARSGWLREGTDDDLSAGATAISCAALWPLMVIVYLLMLLGRWVR